MADYKLLTPGPLTTSETVKQEMLFDHCTWDNDYKIITQEIRAKLLNIANLSNQYFTCVLMQGSGSFGVESVLTSIPKKDEKVLIVTNGVYGKRMVEIVQHADIPYIVYEEDYNKVPDGQKVAEILEGDSNIQYVAMVHSETTTGILNDIESIGTVVNRFNKTFIVDAMSSFGGIEIDFERAHIDFLISSSNKCIQGVPGFSFILANKEKLIYSKGNARSLCLDLYDQWQQMDKDGKWRYTSPTHSVLAFHKALQELEEEGGISKRFQRYQKNNQLLINKLNEIGIHSYLDESIQGPIITTFYFPQNANFNFEQMYNYVKERGYAIYPGKLTDVNTFRIGNIGEIYPEDIEKVCSIIETFLKEIKDVEH